MSKEAMKLALEALLSTYPTCCWDQYAREQDAITALREALADQTAPAQQCMEHGECFGGECIYPATQPAHQEPVSDRENAIIRFALHQFMSNAYSHMNAAAQDKDSRYYTMGAVEKFAKDAKNAEALLSRLQFKASKPAQRKPLTDEEILVANYPDGEENGPTIAAPNFELICFARQIEAKLQEKNT